MRLSRIARSLAAVGLALPLMWPLAAQAQRSASRPNVLIIVADDLGYSDIGAFGGEIATPNLDALALRGIRLAGFHTAPTCSPTRSMLLSGTDNHLAGLGSMAELLRPNQIGQPGYEGYLRPDVVSLAERFAVGGYRTLFSGKWHLGLRPEQDPHARGFERSFALLQGGHNHFGRDITTSFEPGAGVNYREDGVVVGSLPADFYSSDFFAGKMIDYLSSSTGGRRQRADERPFFAYLAFTAPHWPLQAPAADIARYRGRYDEGFEVLRAHRLARQAELGLTTGDVLPHSVRLPQGGWDSLTAEQQRQASRDMEIYAAMVDRLDRNVGRVIDQLRASGELDNTIILFFADNGAEALDGETTGAQMLGRYLATADNSYDNRGGPTSYVTYGPGWAQAATAPSWLHKGYATEGGTRTVAFITGPGISGEGRIANAFLSVADVAPTLLDFAGIPVTSNRFNGRSVRPITGRSWLPWLAGRADRVYGDDEGFGTELFGSRAWRQGDWKIADIGDGRWRLFNIARDPGETQDLSLREPERRVALIAAWDEYARRAGVILPDAVPYRP